VVHACFHRGLMDYLKPMLSPELLLGRHLMVEATRKPRKDEPIAPGPTVFRAIDTILKRPEIPLPDGRSFRDENGDRRAEVRLRWWDAEANTYRKAAACNEELRN
jgi:hypothetical protein